MAKKKNGEPQPEIDTRVRKQVIARRLLCTLTPSELQAAGAKLAEACEDIQNETAAQVDIKAQLKSKIAGLESRRNELASIVRRKADYKEVPVNIFHDYTRAIVDEIRTDTGEVLVSRPMSDSERQAKLFTEPDDDTPAAGATA